MPTVRTAKGYSIMEDSTSTVYGHIVQYSLNGTAIGTAIPLEYFVPSERAKVDIYGRDRTDEYFIFTFDTPYRTRARNLTEVRNHMKSLVDENV